MERKSIKPTRHLNLLVLSLFLLAGTSGMAFQEAQQNFLKFFKEYKGIVVNDRNGDELPSAFLAIEGTNISTVTNSDGEFSLKVPQDMEDAVVLVSHLGFQSKRVPLQEFSETGTEIRLQEAMEELSEVSLFTYTDPAALVRNMLKRRGTNYFADRTNMTAFYRETIKRGRKNVSLSEAVVTIHKQPYTSGADDDIALVKARKTADYDRLDTLALKLRGGPYNPLSVDIMKNPTYIFKEEGLQDFEFSFDDPTKIGDQYLYVVNFEELNHNHPWYKGTLFIDAETFTLVKGSFDLNVDDRKEAADLFVKKKPGGTKVYPVSVHYDIVYREKDGRWYYGYGNTELEFVVNWKRKLFNSRYTVNSELAVTDWKIDTEGNPRKNSNFMDPGIVMTDDISGFADLSFWGENNIIEPDKSIENAIDKIRQKLEKN